MTNAAALGRAPLQRPYVKHYKTADKPNEADLMRSHGEQLNSKERSIVQMRESEAADHIDTLQRLRGEMLLDFECREARRSVNKEHASQLHQQKEEKFERDVVDRQVIGIQHWPFRTEEEVQATVSATNARQKAELDRQLREKQEKREFLESVMAKQSMAEEESAARQAEIARAEARQRQKAMAVQAKGIDKTMDAAFTRYESYLNTRKATDDHSKSFIREQQCLSEQAELLKEEERKRRMAHMRNYLATQVKDKETKKKAAKREALNEVPIDSPSTLPMGTDPDPDEDEYIKMALRHALDQQVVSKHTSQRQTKEEDLREQQHALDCIAREMQQARFRDLEVREDRKQMLDTTWSKQQKLKKMELELERD